MVQPIGGPGGGNGISKIVSGAAKSLVLNVVVKFALGLHARPATMLVDLAVKFKSKIILENAKKKCDAKSIMQLLTLGANQGAELKIYIDGNDAQEAHDALKKFFDKESED